MRKLILIGLMVAFAWVIAARIQTADLGVNNVVDKDLGDITGDTLAPDDTLFTATYSVDNIKGMSSNTSFYIRLDSLEDSTWCVIKLQESWDEGAVWEYTTTVCSIYTVALSIDTGFDVDLFPTPFLRFLVINISGTDSFTVEKPPIFYNHPR